MTSTLRQKSRIARVRRIQHGLAAAAAARASDEVQLLETSAAQLARLRDGISGRADAMSGAALATRGELAMRLDAAREGLNDPIARARNASAARETLRLSARRDQESADKLRQRAAGAATRLAERRASAGYRLRPRRADGGEDA